MRQMLGVRHSSSQCRRNYRRVLGWMVNGAVIWGDEIQWEASHALWRQCQPASTRMVVLLLPPCDLREPSFREMDHQIRASIHYCHLLVRTRPLDRAHLQGNVCACLRQTSLSLPLWSCYHVPRLPFLVCTTPLAHHLFDARHCYPLCWAVHFLGLLQCHRLNVCMHSNKHLGCIFFELVTSVKDFKRSRVHCAIYMIQMLLTSSTTIED